MRPQLFTRALADSEIQDRIDHPELLYHQQKRLRRVRNWKHAGLILLALPLVVICGIIGVVFVPAFFGLRALTRTDYDF